MTKRHEAENRQFMTELARAKEEADKFTRMHLERQAVKDEMDIIEFLKKNEKEHSDYFKVTEEETKELDEEYLKNALKHLFDEKEKMHLLFQRGKIKCFYNYSKKSNLVTCPIFHFLTECN